MAYEIRNNHSQHIAYDGNVRCSANIPVVFPFLPWLARRADNRHSWPTSREIHLSAKDNNCK